MTENIDFDDFLFGEGESKTQHNSVDKAGNVVLSVENFDSINSDTNIEDEILNSLSQINEFSNNEELQNTVIEREGVLEKELKEQKNTDLLENSSINTENIEENSPKQEVTNEVEIAIDNVEIKASIDEQEQIEERKNEELENIDEIENKEKNIDIDSDLEAQILRDLENIPQLAVEETKQITVEEFVEMNKTEEEKRREKEEEEKQLQKEKEQKEEEERKKQEEEDKKKQEEEERKKQEEEQAEEPEDEKSILEKKRQEILSKTVTVSEETVKVENIAGEVKKIEDLDLSVVDYKSFEKINEEHIDLYYLLNDTKENPEFLDEDLLKENKKEEEAREIKKQARQEMDFQLEELVDEDEIRIDIKDILKDIEEEKMKERTMLNSEH